MTTAKANTQADRRTLSVYIDSNTEAALVKAASKQKRSVSSLAHSLIAEGLERLKTKS